MASRDVEYESGLQSNRFDKSNRGEKIRLMLRTFFHVICYVHHFVVFTYAVIFCVQVFNHEIDKVRELSRYVWGFVTNWNMMFQTTFLLVSLIYDVLEWRKSCSGHFAKRLWYCKEILFRSLVAPFTPFVAIFFWSLYWINKELIYPSVFDDVVPWWLNHCIHSNILLVLLGELLVQPRTEPLDTKVEFKVLATIAISYTIVYYSIFFFAHRWLYGVFSVLTWWQVILLHSSALLVVYISFRLQYPLNRLFHKKEEELKPKMMIDVSKWATDENERRNGNGLLNGRDDSGIPFIDKSCVSIKEEVDRS